jgi:hypothetical protein
MFEEMRALVKNDTWDMVSRLFGKNIVGCKWIYSVKHTPKERWTDSGLHTNIWRGL